VGAQLIDCHPTEMVDAIFPRIMAVLWRLHLSAYCLEISSILPQSNIFLDDIELSIAKRARDENEDGFTANVYNG